MPGGIKTVVLDFIHQYGYLALFVYLMLETAFILHFAPSELVVPVAASVLVHGPVTFVLFVLDATAGATAGSLLLYWVFDTYGESALIRYGRYFHLSETDVDRSQRWFQHWGESTVLWGRLLPLVRAVVSAPAGIAHMGRRKFAIYSAVGAAMFNTALTYLVYTGSQTNSPLNLVLQSIVHEVMEGIAYAKTHSQLLAIVFLVILTIAGIAWWQRNWIQANPQSAVVIGLHGARITGIAIGILVIASAFVSPRIAFATSTWVWDDLRLLLQLGLTQQLAVVVTGTLCMIGAAVVFEVGTRALAASHRLEHLLSVLCPANA